MDEVDAFLDPENVKLITSYMKAHLVDICQTIMISHKEPMISETSSLVGCSFVKKTRTSQTFSLDLKRYAEDNNNAAV
jgi:chromosome segregation ATPase